MAVLSLSLVVWLNGSSFNWSSSITSGFTLVDIAPKDFEYQEPDDLSIKGAEAYLVQAEADIKDMREQGFTILYAQDALLEAKESFNSGNYTQVFKLTQLIHFIKNEKIKFIDRVKLIEIKKQALRDKGVTKTAAVNDLMQQAMNAFTLDQFDEANALLDQANDELLQANKEYNRLQTLKFLGRNFFFKYWWEILAVLILLGLSTKPTIRMIRIRWLESKTSRLLLEQDKTKDSIKDLQKECFLDKTIPVSTYKDRAAKYEERITEIKHTLPVVEAELKNLKEKSWAQRFRKKMPRGRKKRR